MSAVIYNFIAALALAIATIGWFDNRRRIEASAVKLAITDVTYGMDGPSYKLTNVGDRDVKIVSVEHGLPYFPHQFTANLQDQLLRRNLSLNVTIHMDFHQKPYVPPHIDVTYKNTFGRKASLAVLLPDGFPAGQYEMSREE